MEARTDFSVFGTGRVLKRHFIDFTKSLRGRISGSAAGGGDSGEDGQGTHGMSHRPGGPGGLKEAFARFRQLRGQRISISETLVGQSGSNGPCGAPNGGAAEMVEINKKEPGSAV